MKTQIIFGAGLWGMDFSPLRPWHHQAIADFGPTIGAIPDYNHDSPAVLLNHATADDLHVVGHSYFVARMFREANMLQTQPVRLHFYCIDGVQAYVNQNEAIKPLPNPAAQMGRPPFKTTPNIVECWSWRRQIGAVTKLAPLALSSPVTGPNVTDVEVVSNMSAAVLLGSAFVGPVGATIMQLIGDTIGHNSIVAAVMPLVMQKLKTALT